MSQSRTIGRNTAILGLARLITMMSGIVLAFLIARKLHATGLGIYSAAMAYYELICTIVDSGGALLLVRELGRDRSKTNYYFVHLCLVGVVVSVTLMPILGFILSLLPLSASVAAAMYSITVSITAGTLISFQESVFVAHQRTGFVTLATLVATTTYAVASAYLLAHGHGIGSLIVAYVATQYAQLAFGFLFIHRYISPIAWDIKPRTLPSLFRQIATFTGMSTLASLFSRPEVIIISVVSSASQIGIYSAALRVVNLWSYIPQVFMTNVFPVLARTHHMKSERAQVIESKAVKYLMASSLPLAIGIFVTAQPLVSLLYGPGFAPAVTVLRILAVNIPLVSLWAVLWRVLVARDQQGVLLRVMFATTMAELGGGGLLIVGLGSLGAAISTSSSSLLYVALLTVWLARSGSRIHFWTLCWRFLLAAIGMGALTWVCSRVVELWVQVPLAAVAYLALILALRAFTADDLALLRRVVGRSTEVDTQLLPSQGPVGQ